MTTSPGRRWRPAALVGIVALVSSMAAPLAASGTPAVADEPASLHIELTQEDGTPGWNWQDDSNSNGVVRTNDLITYGIHLTANETRADVSTVLRLPRGAVTNRVPAFCGEGSSLTPNADQIADPVLPVTATSWQALPEQTLTCVIEGRSGASLDARFDVVAKVRPEMLDGATLIAHASATTDAAVRPLEAEPVTATVAAQAQYDVSKNGLMPIDPNGGAINNGAATVRESPCSYDPAVQCQVIWYAMAVSVPQGAKGNAPASELSFVDDLDPNVFFGAGTTDNPAWSPSFAPRIKEVTASGPDQNLPYSRIGAGGKGTAWNSVRDSGVASFNGTPGGRYTITFRDPDLTGFTYPSANQTGGALPDQQRAAVISGAVFVEFPVAAVAALGAEVDGSWRLRTRNVFEELRVADVSGRGNAPGAEDSRNNARTVDVVLLAKGSYGKFFAAVPGTTGSRRHQDFDTSWVESTGLPAQSSRQSGDAPVSAGQTVISVLEFNNQASTGLAKTTMNTAACDVWNVDQFHLAPGEYPGSAAGGGKSQAKPSGGTAVWLSGTYGSGTTNLERVQYGVVGFVPDPTLTAGVQPAVDGCADGRITWYDSIDAAGGTTKIGAVRVLVSNVRGTGDASAGWVSVALRATDAPRVPGTVMPNYASMSQVWTAPGVTASLPETLAGRQFTNGYTGSDHTGVGLGDRVLAADLFASINKQITDPVSGRWTDETQAFSGGQTASFRLLPSVSSANPAARSSSVAVEDCLPKGLSITRSNREYTIGAGPTDALTCAVGDTHLRWDLGAVAASDSLDPITYDVTISRLLGAGTYTNVARITAQGDPAAVRAEGFPRVTDRQNIAIQVLRGVFLEKQTLTPQTQVNRAGSRRSQSTSWEVRLGNMDTVGPEDMDVIDALPVRSGTTGTAFHGSMSFLRASITDFGSGDPGHDRSMLYYTTASSFDRSPKAASNTNADGSVTSRWSAAPPADPTKVTGVRLVRSGAFASGEQLAFRVDMVGTGNQGGDTYRNVADAVAHTGLGGLLTASSDSAVVESAIGDRVWWDLNRNGVQDEGERGARGVTVQLSGTDDLGNPVSQAVTTDTNGSYAFPQLRASDTTGYRITFVKPDGAEFTKQRAAGAGTDRDSDAYARTGITAPVVVAPNTKNDTIDAGLVPFGALRIMKSLRGVGAEAFGKSDVLTFRAVCVSDGQTVLDRTVTLALQGRSSVTSETLGPLPALADCTVTETDSGNADHRAGAVQVTVPWDATTQTSGVVTASLTNSYSGATLQLTKVVRGDADAVARVRGRVFEIFVACQVEETSANGSPVRADVYSGVVKIKGGKTKQLVDERGAPRLLPAGVHCFGNEIGSGGASKVEIDADSFPRAAVAFGGAPLAAQPLLITAVNTFGCEDGSCDPRADRPDPLPAGRTGLPSTGARVLWGLALLGTGVALGGLILLSRRRRRP